MALTDDILDSPSGNEHKGYAGFWLRVAAYLVDSIILSIPMYAIMFALFGSAMTSENPDPAAMGSGFWLFYVVVIVGVWLYFAYQESSPAQATIGKKLVGIKVTDLEGNRISFMQATGRYFGKIVSSLILLIGYLMVAFTEKRQGLHDIMAGTLVVKR